MSVVMQTEPEAKAVDGEKGQLKFTVRSPNGSWLYIIDCMYLNPFRHITSTACKTERRFGAGSRILYLSHNMTIQGYRSLKAAPMSIYKAQCL